MRQVVGKSSEGLEKVTRVVTSPWYVLAAVPVGTLYTIAPLEPVYLEITVGRSMGSGDKRFSRKVGAAKERERRDATVKVWTSMIMDESVCSRRDSWKVAYYYWELVESAV